MLLLLLLLLSLLLPSPVLLPALRPPRLGSNASKARGSLDGGFEQSRRATGVALRRGTGRIRHERARTSGSIPNLLSSLSTSLLAATEARSSWGICQEHAPGSVTAVCTEVQRGFKNQFSYESRSSVRVRFAVACVAARAVGVRRPINSGLICTLASTPDFSHPANERPPSDEDAMLHPAKEGCARAVGGG